MENLGDPVIVTARLKDFRPTGINGEMQIGQTITSPIRFSLDNNDLKLEEPFLLKSRGKKQLLVKIRVPEGLPDGDYYQVLSFDSDTGAQFQGLTAVKNSVSVAVPILVTVSESGKTEVSGHISLFTSIEDFSLKILGTTYSFIESNSPLPIRLIVSNSGKNKINPVGTIEVESGFGNKNVYSILPDNILSQSERLVHASPSAYLECTGALRSKGCGISTSIVDTGMHLGKTTIRTAVNFGPGTDLQYASFTIFALPIRFIFALCIIVGLSWTIYYSTRSNPKFSESEN